MVTVTQRPDGSVAIESDTGPKYLLVTGPWLNEFVRALYEADMLAINGASKSGKRP